MFCKKCGVSLEENAKFCANCGTEVTAEAETVKAVPEKNPNAKSRLAAGLLGIFLGAFGVHNFYLGFTGKAIAQLLLGIFCLGSVSGIWGLIEGILYLCKSNGFTTDAEGKELID